MGESQTLAAEIEKPAQAACRARSQGERNRQEPAGTTPKHASAQLKKELLTHPPLHSPPPLPTHLSRPEKRLQHRLIHRLDALVIEVQPAVVALDHAHVVAVVWPGAHVHDNGGEIVGELSAGGVVGGVAQAQLVREDDPMQELLVAALRWGVARGQQICVAVESG